MAHCAHCAHFTMTISANLNRATPLVHMGQCAPEDSISQCPFLQMIEPKWGPQRETRQRARRSSMMFG
jgi:hypothetical protein